MILYRLAQARFADKLQSSGAPNRWNRFGQHVIYTSGSISLCSLELLAHTNGIRPSGVFKVMHIEINPLIRIYTLNRNKLPVEWHLLSAYPVTQMLGSEWYETASSLVMKIPSAIIPSEWNYVINTKHPDFIKNIKLIESQDFFWDHRFPTEV